MSKLEDMRDTMQRHLGDDWEILLVVGKAIAPLGASPEQFLTAQQRAIALVRDEISPNWTDDEVGELIADARSRIWPRSPGFQDGLAG